MFSLPGDRKTSYPLEGDNVIHFGPHLMLDFFCSPEHLNDKFFWESLLSELVEEIGMTAISPPCVYDSSCTNTQWDPPAATGLSGFIVLAESHISFHTFVESGYVFLDVFSCKPFDHESVTSLLVKRLGAERFNVNFVGRGANFPFPWRDVR